MNGVEAVTEPLALTSEQLEQYHRDGFLGPFTLCSPREMTALRQRISQVIDPIEDDPDLPSMITVLNPAMRSGFGRHHQHRFLFDLACAPRITQKVAGIMGEDLLLWRTMFFRKVPGGEIVPWHQDFDGWELEPMLVTSCWLAIDDVTRANGCVQFIPGSHRHYYPFVPTTGEVMDGFPQMADPRTFDESTVVSMELRPGQFFLFNERVLHRSLVNTSGSERLGLTMRYIPPLVRALDPEDRPIVVSGQDRLGFNRPVLPPPPQS